MHKKPDPVRERIAQDNRITVGTPSEPTDGARVREVMKVYRVRLPERDVLRLEQYLGTLGLSLSAGIRMAVNQMLQRVGR